MRPASVCCPLFESIPWYRSPIVPPAHQPSLPSLLSLLSLPSLPSLPHQQSQLPLFLLSPVIAVVMLVLYLFSKDNPNRLSLAGAFSWCRRAGSGEAGDAPEIEDEEDDTGYVKTRRGRWGRRVESASVCETESLAVERTATAARARGSARRVRGVELVPAPRSALISFTSVPPRLASTSFTSSTSTT